MEKEPRGPEEVKPYKRQYQKRKAAGLCTSTGCTDNPEVGHTQCRRHLKKISERNKERYLERTHRSLCIYCGKRPRFWGVRCIICRQRFAKDPLPVGVRKALRTYREAERLAQAEQTLVDFRKAADKLLKRQDINGRGAAALRLYAGLDNSQWRTYAEVAKVMKITKQAVHRLLLPSRVAMAHLLGDDFVWGSRKQASSQFKQ